MLLRLACLLLLSLLLIDNGNSISSPIQPFTTYQHSTELQADIADLWWTVDDGEKEITFEMHMKTTGWIALGISPSGGMEGADIGVGWVDQKGTVHFQDRHAFGHSKPVLDEKRTHWFVIQGREQDGWTAIQFRRLLDTCNAMDVSIKSGTNILIFAYGLADPDPDISYHDSRRGTRILPLRSYSDPPSDSKYAGVDSFEFRLNNYVIPPVDTTYHCKVYKVPTHFPTKRHTIAHKVLLDSDNHDFVHHMIMSECDPMAQFDDNNLPDDLCDAISNQIMLCVTNTAVAWAIGGDSMIEYPEEAGFPIGGDFDVKYYLIQIHYDNPKLIANRRDSSGVRFYIGTQLRQHDIGYLGFGTDPSAWALAIPPGVDRFIVNSYCPATATRNFPKSGITVFSAFPHTHLQGQSVWTKLIRNRTAVQYLFNADAYDFNYQFHNHLAKRIQLYPGDEFATQCVYNTKNKDEITLGGERTKDEMCLHGFTYYPRMSDLTVCVTYNELSAWQTVVNFTGEDLSLETFKQKLKDIKWTPKLAAEWQKFYDNAAHGVAYGESFNIETESFPTLPKYKDLEILQCNFAIGHQTSAVFILATLLMLKTFLI